MKYCIRTEGGEPQIVSREEFIDRFQHEFMWGKGYYEHMFILLGHGHQLVGSQHMFWIDWEE